MRTGTSMASRLQRPSRTFICSIGPSFSSGSSMWMHAVPVVRHQPVDQGQPGCEPRKSLAVEQCPTDRDSDPYVLAASQHVRSQGHHPLPIGRAHKDYTLPHNLLRLPAGCVLQRPEIESIGEVFAAWVLVGNRFQKAIRVRNHSLLKLHSATLASSGAPEIEQNRPD